MLKITNLILIHFIFTSLFFGLCQKLFKYVSIMSKQFGKFAGKKFLKFTVEKNLLS